MQKQYSLQQESKLANFPKRFSEIPYQELLEQTTLKEFLTALEMVNTKGVQKIVTDQVDTSHQRKSSFISI